MHGSKRDINYIILSWVGGEKNQWGGGNNRGYSTRIDQLPALLIGLERVLEDLKAKMAQDQVNLPEQKKVWEQEWEAAL